MTRLTEKEYSSMQIIGLVVLRTVLGWHFLYEGIAKILDPDWSARVYLKSSYWIFEPVFSTIGTNRTFVQMADIFVISVLFIVGLALMLGFMIRPVTIIAASLLCLFYLSHPPFGEGYQAQGGNYLIIDRNLIEIGALWIIRIFPVKSIGLQVLFAQSNKE